MRIQAGEGRVPGEVRGIRGDWIALFDRPEWEEWRVKMLVEGKAWIRAWQSGWVDRCSHLLLCRLSSPYFFNSSFLVSCTMYIFFCSPDLRSTRLVLITYVSPKRSRHVPAPRKEVSIKVLRYIILHIHRRSLGNPENNIIRP